MREEVLPTDGPSSQRCSPVISRLAQLALAKELRATRECDAFMRPMLHEVWWKELFTTLAPDAPKPVCQGVFTYNRRGAGSQARPFQNYKVHIFDSSCSTVNCFAVFQRYESNETQSLYLGASLRARYVAHQHRLGRGVPAAQLAQLDLPELHPAPRHRIAHACVLVRANKKSGRAWAFKIQCAVAHCYRPR